jgi:hypothetical protein
VTLPGGSVLVDFAGSDQCVFGAYLYDPKLPRSFEAAPLFRGDTGDGDLFPASTTPPMENSILGMKPGNYYVNVSVSSGTNCAWTLTFTPEGP